MIHDRIIMHIIINYYYHIIINIIFPLYIIVKGQDNAPAEGNCVTFPQSPQA